MTTAIDLRPYEVVCDVSDRDAWLDRRADGIGASEIAAVLGESPWMSIRAIVEELREREAIADCAELISQPTPVSKSGERGRWA